VREECSLDADRFEEAHRAAAAVLGPIAPSSPQESVVQVREVLVGTLLRVLHVILLEGGLAPEGRMLGCMLDEVIPRLDGHVVVSSAEGCHLLLDS
jgi:hypothetical protein